MLDKNFNFKDIEEKLYKSWEDSGLFSPAGDGNPYTIMMPPPNVTGILHVGHALNHTLQDILIRYHRMKGRKTLWQPGTDHAGIATQMMVERKLEKDGLPKRKEMGREAFLEHAWQWKEESGGAIVGQLGRLGTTPDWSRERFTMDEGLSKAVLKAFVSLYNDGLIYKDNRLVNWHPGLETAISDLEVEQKEQKGKMWHIRYPIEGETEQFITVATTRPETMLGDTAVAVHPDDARYKDVVGKSVSLPITGRLIPIVADDYSDPEKGSGAVKITPAHDFNDFEVGKRHDLPMINIFTRQAKIIEHEDIPKKYHGLDRFVARKEVLKELEELDLLVEIENIKHAVPYDEKTKTVVIEPFLTEQWFVDTPTLAKPAAQAVRDGRTRFIPQQYENMYFQWVDNQLPWCISRQLWWGHQIPAWYDKDGKVYVAETEEEAQAQAGEGVTLTRDDDVLDTWFSSALWAFSTLGWPDKAPELVQYYPGDTLVTSFDIITFWVSRMMMFSLYFMDDVPFKDVYIHALVRDKNGQKMSKTKGNVMDPLDLIDKYGADALRFTLCALCSQGRDIRLAEDRLEGYRNFVTKLWNASKYAEMNKCNFDPAFNPATAKYVPNQWIIGETFKAAKSFEKSIDEYRFNDAANGLYHFVWGTFCDWYLEFTKASLSSEGEHADEIRKTTAWVLSQTYILLNPVMPFVTEHLYAKRVSDEEALITKEWPVYDVALVKNDSSQQIEWIIKIISEIRSVRADMNVPAGAKIPLLVKDACENSRNAFQNYNEILKRMARLESIDFTDAVPKGALQTVVEPVTLILPIADIIDLDAEKERLKKQLSKLEDDIQKVSQQLENKNFVERAPAEVIAEKEEQRETAKATHAKVSAALEQLEAA